MHQFLQWSRRAALRWGRIAVPMAFGVLSGTAQVTHASSPAQTPDLASLQRTFETLSSDQPYVKRSLVLHKVLLAGQQGIHNEAPSMEGLQVLSKLGDAKEDVDFTELVFLYCLANLPEGHIAVAFEIADEDASGYLSANEVLSVLNRVSTQVFGPEHCMDNDRFQSLTWVKHMMKQAKQSRKGLTRAEFQSFVHLLRDDLQALQYRAFAKPSAKGQGMLDGEGFARYLVSRFQGEEYARKYKRIDTIPGVLAGTTFSHAEFDAFITAFSGHWDELSSALNILSPGRYGAGVSLSVLKRAMSAATHCDIPLAMVEILYHVFSESGLPTAMSDAAFTDKRMREVALALKQDAFIMPLRTSSRGPWETFVHCMTKQE